MKKDSGTELPSYKLVYTQEARMDLREIRQYIASRASSRIADSYVRSLRAFCRTLTTAPQRGESRAHLRPGLRSIGFKRRVSVIFTVSDQERVVRMVAFHYAGRQNT
jgi:toxin ParE1/3/4